MADADGTQTQVITIVQDKNFNMDDAMDVIKEFLVDGRVTGCGETTVMAGPALYAYVREAARADLVAALNAKGFRIVEGGQQ